MTQRHLSDKKEPKYFSSLSDAEKKELDEKVKFELEQNHYSAITKMTVIGGLSNLFAGMFVLWVMYHQIALDTLFNWYAGLISFNLLNIGWSGFFKYKYKEITSSLLKKWRYGFYFIFSGLSLTWGFIGVLFVPPSLHYQVYVVTFLQVATLSFAFSTFIDFRLSLMSISCLLLPTITYEIFHGFRLWKISQPDYIFNLSLGISLLILGIYLIVICFLGYVLTKSQATLSALNAGLNEKLENSNKFLEQRVKERTLELEESLKLVTYQVTHDLLTNLPNQLLLTEYTKNAINAESTRFFALVCFSLNEITKINDWLGHHIGDTIIKIIAERFRTLLNKLNKENTEQNYVITLTRKDVFVILIKNISPKQVETKSKLLLQVVAEPIEIEKQNINLTASIGVSLYPHDGNDVESLLMNADAAMGYAKEAGGNQLYIYSEKIKDRLHKQIKIESKLYTAIKNGEFLLHYQPIIDIKTNKICSIEALARWQSPLLGIISPDDFIHLAEANGLIIPLGEWILNTACKQLKKIHQLHFDELQIAINLSSKQLQQKNSVQTIIDIIAASGLDPRFVELELTEREAFNEDMIPRLREIQKSGICFAIDDFGTGHSGLSKLKLFPVNKIKIDKSFIKDLETNSDSQQIVANAIDLAKRLNITVLIEGVETKEQLEFVKKHGCDLVQGFYFSKGLPADELLQLLEKNKNEIIV